MSKRTENKEQEIRQELVFGKNSVMELIKSEEAQVNKIWISERLKNYELKEKIISYSKEKKIPFHIVNENKLISLTSDQNHQGIVASISPVKYYSVEEITAHEKVVLIAHETEDPRNLGAMIRTFVGAGGKGIILTGRSNVGITATVMKTSAGALLQACLARASNCMNILNELKKNNFWIVGTDNSKDSRSVYDTDFPDRVAIVVGNEHEGLGQLIKKNCDFLVRVPISNKIDSLNVSVAFGIILFEILRQKKK